MLLALGGVMAFAFPCEVNAQAKAPVKVACVGNSITFGSAIENPEQYSYPSQLQVMLGDGYEVKNFGRPGATLLKRGHRPYNEQPEYQAALDYAPDLAVIHLGVNDTDPRDWPYFRDDFIPDYLSLINDLRQVNPDVRILIARLTPITHYHKRYKSGTQLWRDMEQEAIEQVAQIAGVELIDFNAPLVDLQGLLPDAVHPNEEGYGLLAETVYKGITGNYGGLQMPIPYTSGMVLQRYKPLNVKGTADAGSTVTVKIAGNEATAVANNRGEWAVTLPPMTEATGLTMTVSDGKKTLTFDDVAVGEVWIASGQSNMAFLLKQATTAQEDIAASADKDLRFFNMKPQYFPYATPMPENFMDSINHLRYYFPTQWEASSPETSPDMSAVAYYFGRMLRDSLQVPVGIIHNAIGGSPCESWIDIETLQHGLPEVLLDWRHNDYVQPWVQKRTTENIGTDNPAQRHPYEPTYLFATGIRPLGSYPLAGVIWYQGESNEQNVEVHEKLFPLLVDSWRSYWDEPNMPFIFTQLSSIAPRNTWPHFRDSQRRLMEQIPGTGMAVSHDWGDSLDVHPRNKRPVGERLARWALHDVYSKGNVVPSGPLPVSAVPAEDGAVLVSFRWGEGMTSSDGQPVGPFELAEVDGYYFPATAQVIQDNQIKVSSMYVKNPRYVRYAWQPFTHGNLVNSTQLPASTFKLEVVETPEREAGIASGVSALYAGMCDGLLVSAGGCNFPENPMAPGAQKKFYQSVYAYNPASATAVDSPVSWTRIGSLPQPMAYGCAVSTDVGIVIIGGTSATEALSSCYILHTTADGSAIEMVSLPSLPATLDNMAAAAIERKVYVAGGNYAGAPSNRLLCLDLNDPAKGWVELPAFPGNPRVQPVLAAGKNAKDEVCLYMFGGFAGRGEGREPSLNTDGLVYSPKSKKWSPVAGPVDPEGNPLSVGGGAACTLTDGKILVVGGVNAEIFLEALRNQAPDYLSHPIEWYRFNPYVLAFDPAKAAWTILGSDSDTARAGAAIVAGLHNDAYVLGGELKPRIRTPHVSYIK